MEGIIVAEMGFRTVLDEKEGRWKEKRDGFWTKNEEKKGFLGLVRDLREVDDNMVKEKKKVGNLQEGGRRQNRDKLCNCRG